MLSIKNLAVQIAGKPVVDNVNLEIKAGELAILMGPNGSGKSSLAMVLMGHPDYTITAGAIYFNNQDITNLAVHERAKLGLFLAFQHPRAIAGLQVFSFLKTTYEVFTGKIMDVRDFENLLLKNLELVGLDKSFIYRDVNSGFSGGEKKSFEILQFLLLQPKLAIIDEIDSGLDIDALKLVAQAINFAKKKCPELSIILITHYSRIINFLEPETVYVMQHGKLVKSGDIFLANQIEQFGYDQI